MSDIFQTDEYIVKDNPYLDQGSSGGIGGDLDDLSDSTTDITDNDKIVSRQNSDGAWYKKTFSKVWDYIKSKIQASSIDTANNTTTFTSSDTTDANAASWTSVTKLDSGESHASIFAKMSQMFKNIRYLYKMLGTTDISQIGGGNVTGAISALNTSLTNSLKDFIKTEVTTTAIVTVASKAIGTTPIVYPTTPSGYKRVGLMTVKTSDMSTQATPSTMGDCIVFYNGWSGSLNLRAQLTWLYVRDI